MMYNLCNTAHQIRSDQERKQKELFQYMAELKYIFMCAIAAPKNSNMYT